MVMARYFYFYIACTQKFWYYANSIKTDSIYHTTDTFYAVLSKANGITASVLKIRRDKRDNIGIISHNTPLKHML